MFGVFAFTAKLHYFMSVYMYTIFSIHSYIPSGLLVSFTMSHMQDKFKLSSTVGVLTHATYTQILQYRNPATLYSFAIISTATSTTLKAISILQTRSKADRTCYTKCFILLSC